MSERAVALLAVSIAAGAWLSGPPLALGSSLGMRSTSLIVALLALAAMAAVGPATLRREARGTLVRTLVLVVVCLAGAIAAWSLGVRAWSGLHVADDQLGRVEGIATLVADPVRVPGGVAADVRFEGHRCRSAARGPSAARFAALSAGQRAAISGELRGLPHDQRARFASRHLACRLEIGTIERTDEGNLLARAANGLRQSFLRGAASLPSEQRALLAGIVLGDDREQDVAQVEDFRSAGLTHLLAVSGQNVGFALTLAAPLLRGARLWPRLALAVALLVVFGAMTRWEPSVLRAVGMAVIAVFAATLGRVAHPRRILAVAVSVLLLVDPLLVRSIGFLLSVGACLSILLFAPVFARRMPAPLAVTLAAQVGVAPIAIPMFGGIPLASVPANLLAVPAAGPLMMWGLGAGLPAGMVGEAAGRWVHFPSRGLLLWIGGVARLAAWAPLGTVTATTAVIAAIVGTAVALVHLRGALPAGAAIAVAIAMTPVIRPPPATDLPIADGAARLWRRGASTVVVADGRSPPGDLLAALRSRHVRRVDVLVSRSRSAAAGDAIGAVVSRLPVGLVLAPIDRQYGTGRAPVLGLTPGLRARAGPFTISIGRASDGDGRRTSSTTLTVTSDRRYRP